jgi:hypothetical protein
MARAGAAVVLLAGAVALGFNEAQCNAARRGSVDVIVGAQWGDEVNDGSMFIYNYTYVYKLYG